MTKHFIRLAVTVMFIFSAGTLSAQQILMSCDFGIDSHYSTGIIGANDSVGGQAVPEHRQLHYSSMWEKILPNSQYFNDYYPVISTILNIDSVTSALQTPGNGLMIMSMMDQVADFGGYGSIANFDAYIVFPGFSTENIYSPLILNFYNYYRAYHNDRCWIDYSIDSVNWDCIEVSMANTLVPINGQLSGKQNIVLPSNLSNQENVYIRIRWSSTSSNHGAYGYFWLIDDVSVSSVPNEYDHAISFVCHDNVQIAISKWMDTIMCTEKDSVWNHYTRYYKAEIQDGNYYIDSIFVDGNPIVFNSQNETIYFFCLNDIDSSHTVDFQIAFGHRPIVNLSCIGSGSGYITSNSFFEPRNLINDFYDYLCGNSLHVNYNSRLELIAVPDFETRFIGWSNGITDSIYTVTVTDDTAIAAVFAKKNVEVEICMVTVQNKHNVIVWEKGDEVRNYYIYREKSVLGEYELIGVSPYDSLSVWEDVDSRPATRSYRYKIAAEDIYGYPMPLSSEHKTMHLSINKGMGNSWNLSWNEYEGAEFTTYMMYRGTENGNLELLDEMPVGGNTTYTDIDAPEGTVYYQVCVLKNEPCFISKNGDNLIRSNIATNNPVGIENSAIFDMNAYVCNGRIFVNGVDGQTVNITDITGRQIYCGEYMVNGYNVPLSGIYIVKVGDCQAQKVVVIK